MVTLNGISIVVNEVQPSKACTPMVVTLLGIVTRNNEVQLKNVPSMLVTPLGISNDTNELHPINTPFPKLDKLGGISADVSKLQLANA